MEISPDSLAYNYLGWMEFYSAVAINEESIALSQRQILLLLHTYYIRRE